MTEPTPPVAAPPVEPASAPPAGRPAPRVVVAALLACVAVGSLADLAATPRESDLQTLVARAQSGEVRTLQLLPGGDTRNGFYLRIGPGVDGDGPPSVRWTESSGLRYEADLPPDAVATDVADDPFDDPFDDGGASRGQRSDARLDVLATVRLAAGREAPPELVPPGGLMRERVALLGVLSLVVLLAVLVRGPQPRRATKWAWVWLTLLPYGVGQAALLLRDAPWSPQAVARPEPTDRFDRPPGRLTGGRAFALAVLVGIAMSALAALVAPAAYEQPAPYVEVLEDGTRRPA